MERNGKKTNQSQRDLSNEEEAEGLVDGNAKRESVFYCLSVFISTDKVLIHCCDGVSHSPTLFLAYLTIHRDTMMEESIDCIIKV